MIRRILGLDISLTATGFCLLRPPGLVLTADVVKYPKDVDGDARLAYLARSISEVIKDAGIDLAVVEDLPRGARGAAEVGMAHGAVRAAMRQADLRYVLTPPANVKVYATGKGTATKADMRMSLYKRTGFDVSNDNIVDAMWLAAMGADALGSPWVDVPANHRQTLDRLGWSL